MNAENYASPFHSSIKVTALLIARQLAVGDHPHAQQKLLVFNTPFS